MLSESNVKMMYELQLGGEAATFCHNVTDWPFRKITHKSIYLLGEILGYSQEHVDEDFSEAINKLIPMVMGA